MFPLIRCGIRGYIYGTIQKLDVMSQGWISTHICGKYVVYGVNQGGRVSKWIRLAAFRQPSSTISMNKIQRFKTQLSTNSGTLEARNGAKLTLFFPLLFPSVASLADISLTETVGCCVLSVHSLSVLCVTRRSSVLTELNRRFLTAAGPQSK